TTQFAPDARPNVYIVINGKFAPDFDVVRASTLPIVTRSFETSVRANTRSTLLASYQFATSRGWQLNLASIDPDYPKSASSVSFDPVYAAELFEYGYQRGKGGVLWQSAPSEFRAGLPNVARR